MSTNYISDDAPFNAEQRVWLNNLVSNFINDLTSGKGLSGVGGEVVPVKILFGSQTGNSEALAKKLAKVMAKGNFAPEVVDMGDYEPGSLTVDENILIITSTYGDGEPPDNAADLHEFILSDAAPRLENLNYSIFALGDTEYPDFCKCGIEFDDRLAELGANRIFPRVDCDVEYDELYNQWKKGVLDALGATAAPLTVSDDDEVEDGYSKTNPFPSAILNKYNLNGSGSQRETHHIEFSLEGSDLEYHAGDALSVLPVNPEDVVDEIIKSLPFNTNDEVPFPSGKAEGSLKDALMYHYDIRSLSKGLLEEWQKRSGSPYLRALMQGGTKEDFDNFIWGRELVDLVTDCPADFADGEEFVSVLKKLQPRLYSISSSPKAHLGEVHLTVAIVRYHSNYRDRGGVCSSFLADRVEGVQPKVFVHVNKAFRLPTDLSKPIIMCGPGTGIAPFRAFLEERRATEATGKNWLLFGNPHEATDFLYRNEIDAMLEDGTLSKLDTAFSRDQAEKIYVQDRMIEAGAELWQWLHDDGGYFYVCGDASRMAKDVDVALHKIAQQHGGLSEEDAKAYFKQMKKDKRYARDVY